MVVLSVVSVIACMAGYYLAFNNRFSMGVLVEAALWCLVCGLAAAVPIAVIESYGRRSRKGWAYWMAIAVSLFILGFVVEVFRYGID